VAEPIRFFADQHFPGPVSHALARHGIDALTVQDAGRCGLPDPDQLAFATAEERVMLTFDTDYLALHYSGAQHAGIVWCRAEKYRIGELFHLLLTLFGVFTADEMRNRIEYL
jgi:predicted nuclease of predicted toxin-antitoxin system